MKLNIVLLILTALLLVEAGDTDSLRRELSKGKKKTVAKKTYTKKTYTKTYTKSRTSYTGQFYGGKSYAILYVYYLPPNYYSIKGYYSPVYL